MPDTSSMDEVKSKVSRCARCGQDHEVEFKKLKKPIEIGLTGVTTTYTHWGMCPINNEPILMFWE